MSCVRSSSTRVLCASPQVVKLVNHRKEKADSPDLVIVDTVGICDDKAAASSVICVDDVSRQKRRATHSLDSNQVEYRRLFHEALAPY